LIDSVLDSWILFSVCCLGLWIPGWPLLALKRMHPLKKVKRSAPWKAALGYAPNWSDFVRAGCVSYVLGIWGKAYTHTHPENALTATAATFASLAMGTILQCQAFKHGRFMVLPTFYVMGLVLFVAGWDIGLFTVGCILAAGFSIPDRNGLLPLLSLILVAGGFLVGAPITHLAMGAFMGLIPFMIFVLTGKTGIQPTSYIFNEDYQNGR
jgi:hypothetical protein